MRNSPNFTRKTVLEFAFSNYFFFSFFLFDEKFGESRVRLFRSDVGAPPVPESRTGTKTKRTTDRDIRFDTLSRPSHKLLTFPIPTYFRFSSFVFEAEANDENQLAE